ncbi:MAG: DUF4912 domain-containing protein [Methylococcales bacterium]|nr:DUF4912 domain-containing protein [Methylococcales bacterium]
MLEISQEINREFTPGALPALSEPASKIKLSSTEMFEISEEIRQNFAPRAENNAQELVLLPVDPDHLYAYWNLPDTKPDIMPKTDSENQLTLRIYSEANKNTGTVETKPWFDVAIDNTQAQQSVFLSKQAHETTYSAAIGQRFPDNSLSSFADSNITHVPPGRVKSGYPEETQTRLKPMPKLNATSREEVSTFMKKSASGQGHHP